MPKRTYDLTLPSLISGFVRSMSVMPLSIGVRAHALLILIHMFERCSRFVGAQHTNGRQLAQGKDQLMIESRAFPKTSIAIISVGLVRSMSHPAVVASFTVFKQSLEHQGHMLRTFILVSIDTCWKVLAGTCVDNKHSNTSRNAVYGERWRLKLRRLYRPTELWLTSGRLPCNTRCTKIPCVGRPGISESSDRSDAPIFLQQFFKVSLAWEAVANWENKFDLRFDWFLKVRPDILWFGNFPQLQQFSSSQNVADGDWVYVPRGVMTDMKSWYHLNDHILLCPRKLCSGYFASAIASYKQCTRSTGMKIPYPPQLLLFNYTCTQGYHCYRKSRLMDVPYTLVREFGPQCPRLYSAPHLWRFYQRCYLILEHWKTMSSKKLWLKLLQSMVVDTEREIHSKFSELHPLERKPDLLSQFLDKAPRKSVPNGNPCDWGLSDAGIDASCHVCNQYKDGRDGAHCQYVPERAKCFPDYWARRYNLVVQTHCQA